MHSASSTLPFCFSFSIAWFFIFQVPELRDHLTDATNWAAEADRCLRDALNLRHVCHSRQNDCTNNSNYCDFHSLFN